MARARSGGSPSSAWAITLLGAGFLICGILAALFFAQKGGVQEELDDAQRELSALLGPGEANSDAINAAREEANENRVSIARALLDSIAQAERNLSQANAKIDDLQAQLASEKNLKAETENNLARAQRERDEAERGLAAATNTFNQQARDLEARVGSAEAANRDLQQQLDTYETVVREDTETARRSLQALIDELRVENDQLERQYTSALDELLALRAAREAQFAKIAQPDARIAAVTNNGNTAFLDIGQNQRVQRGMTFSIYDEDELVKLEGDPDLEPKAVLEVFDVMENSSTARLVTPLGRGQRLTVGDAAINLVFDPSRTFRFFVFGDFDLEGTGTPTAAQAERVKARVQQWGGNVAEEIDFDVDYLVLGNPPELPRELTGSERADPIRIQQHNAATRKYNTYAELESQARDYNIPILNQNRFLDLIGDYTR